MTRQAIRNIVFDIGWVLVRLNYRPILSFLEARGAEVGDRDAVMERIALTEHESGRMHGRGLLERIQAVTREPISLEEAHAHWVDMFELEPAMVELAHRLSERYRVYLLSNIGDLHWAHLSREYRLHAIGQRENHGTRVRSRRRLCNRPLERCPRTSGSTGAQYRRPAAGSGR